MSRTGLIVLALVLASASAKASPSDESVSSRVEINQEALLSRFVGLPEQNVLQRFGRPESVRELRFGRVRWNYQWGKDQVYVEIRNGKIERVFINPRQEEEQERSTGFIEPSSVNP